MVDQVDVILGLFKDRSKVTLQAGEYRGLDGLRALVDFSGGRVPAHPVTAYRPELNEPVWVAVVDGVAYLLGPTVPKPADGTVVSVASGIAQISTDIGTVAATYNSGVTLTGGQVVKLFWGNGCHVLGVKSTSPEVPTVPAAPGGSGGRVTKTFTATGSGSYQAGYGWRTNEVWSSASNKGAWFYGSKIKDTIPSTATIIKAEIYLPKPGKQIGARPFGRHAYASKPAGEPTISDTSTLSGTSGWVPFPTTIVDWLKANVGGVGFALGGWWTWPGTQKDGQSGALRITYET